MFHRLSVEALILPLYKHQSFYEHAGSTKRHYSSSKWRHQTCLKIYYISVLDIRPTWHNIRNYQLFADIKIAIKCEIIPIRSSA